MVDLWGMSAHMSTQSFVALRCVLALGIFRELITARTRTTSVAFWDPPSGSKNIKVDLVQHRHTRRVLFPTEKNHSAKAVGTSVYMSHRLTIEIIKRFQRLFYCFRRATPLRLAPFGAN